jgi:hypothetical protein
MRKLCLHAVAGLVLMVLLAIPGSAAINLRLASPRSRQRDFRYRCWHLVFSSDS